MPEPILTPDDSRPWRPVGEISTDQCAADPECTVRPGWRITTATAATPETIDTRGVIAYATEDADSFLACTPHLGQSLALCDESYASPMLVEVHRG